MPNRHGIPIWYELIVPDPNAAERFYGSILGWHFQQQQGDLEIDYRVAMAGEAGVGGLMRQPPGMTMPPRWLIYFGVDDVDRATSEAEAAGAQTHITPTDIPGVGRFSFLADPQGAMFYLMRATRDEESRAFQAGAKAPQGHAVWNELSAADPDAAIAFYGALLGLRQDGSMPMGDLGEYRFVYAGPDGIGAVMGIMPNGAPGWRVYFSVDDIDAAADRVTASGGKLVHEPDEIPGGLFALVGDDPFGARFGLVGPRS